MKPGTKGATSFGNLPLGDRERAWDRGAADKRVRSWAGADEAPNAKYRNAFFWYDSGAAEIWGSYKLQFADVVGGTLTAIPRGIFACAGVMQGARGGVDIPAGDEAGVKAHIGRYYAKMRSEWNDDTITPPWKAKADASGGLEVKTYPCEFKVDSDARQVEAYASIFGNVDLGGDRANRGMFADSIQNDFGNIAYCWQHGWDWPIGVPLVLEEDSSGLFTRSYVSETTRGNDALVLMRDGAVKQMSFAYNAVRSTMDEATGVRDLLQVDLMEYSPVTWGMNKLARITGVKAGQYRLALKRFAAMQEEISGGRSLDRDSLMSALDALKALLDATPDAGLEADPPSPDGTASDADEKALEEIAVGLTDFVGVHGIRQDLEQFSRQLARGR